MRTLALLLLTLGLAACVPAEGNTAKPTDQAEAAIPADEQSCKAAGATWRRVCLMGTWSCVVTYADAGKTCRDGDECLRSGSGADHDALAGGEIEPPKPRKKSADALI